MEPPPSALTPDSPAHDEFYLWCATLLEHGHSLPTHRGQSASEEKTAATELSPSTHLQIMEGMKRVRAKKGARAVASELGPILETVRTSDVAGTELENTWSEKRQSAAIKRRRTLAATIFALVLAALVIALWRFGLPKGAPAPLSPATAPSPTAADIPVSEIAKALAVNRQPPVPPLDGDSEQLALRADNITHAGEVLAASGDLPEALRFYRQALAIRRGLAARDPGNVAWQHVLAGGWVKVADLLKLQGDPTRALGSYRAAETVEQGCARAQPGNWDFQRDLFFDALNIGNLLLAQNDPAGALEAFRRGSTIQTALCDLDPKNTAWQGDLAVSFQRMADAMDLLGDSGGALQDYQSALRIEESLAARDSSNRDWEHDLAMTQWRIGDLLLSCNETDAALQRYGEALVVVQKLVDLDGANADWQRELAETHDRIGQALEVKKHPDEALRPYQQALSIAEHLAARNSADSPGQGLVASVSYHLGRATVQCQPADIPAARHALETSHDLLVNLRTADGATFSREQAEMLNDTERLLAQLGQ